MHVSPVRAAAVGGGIAVAIVAFVVRPAALVPHPVPSPSLEASALADDAPQHPSPAARATPRRLLVYVAGAVVRPGVYALPADARGEDALRAAGGFARDADTVAVNLAAPVADGDEIPVPRLGDSSSAKTARGGRATRTGGTTHRKKRNARPRRRRADATDDATADAPAHPLDLNHADAQALATIPGVGATLAARIVTFRDVNGPFASVDGLADVAGITASRFDAIAPYLTVERP